MKAVDVARGDPEAQQNLAACIFAYEAGFKTATVAASKKQEVQP
jgi:hypothetical protein